jgi:hypothetical protein
MKQTKIITAAVLAAAAIPVTAVAVVPAMYEQRVARAEEERIIRSPIGGIEGKRWYNYRANVNETQKELSSDLRAASTSKPWPSAATACRASTSKASDLRTALAGPRPGCATAQPGLVPFEPPLAYSE